MRVLVEQTQYVAQSIVNRLQEDRRRVLPLAGKWHDMGKSHPAFQGTIRAADRPNRPDWRKARPAHDFALRARTSFQPFPSIQKAKCFPNSH
jgi:hypothetical protein